MYNRILLRGVVEVNAHHEVEVATGTQAPPDSDGAGPALPTADLHDIYAIDRVIVEGGEVGEELVNVGELGGLRRTQKTSIS